jgi:hypothetical protein
MGGQMTVERPPDIIAHVVLSNIKLSAVGFRPTLRFQLQGPGELLSDFFMGWTPSHFSVNGFSRLLEKSLFF